MDVFGTIIVQTQSHRALNSNATLNGITQHMLDAHSDMTKFNPRRLLFTLTMSGHLFLTFDSCEDTVAGVCDIIMCVTK